MSNIRKATGIFINRKRNFRKESFPKEKLHQRSEVFALKDFNPYVCVIDYNTKIERNRIRSLNV